MSETTEQELDLLKIRARAAGFHCERHRFWDPARGGGDLYLQRAKKYRGDPSPSICRFATPDQIHRHLARAEEQNRHDRKINGG